MSKIYQGVLIQESLIDPSILETLKVVKTVVQIDQDNPREEWHLCSVEVTLEDIERIQSYLKREGGWYAHFWNGEDLVVAFHDRLFEMNKSDKATWSEAIIHGLSVGVPAEQLDFLT